MTFRPNKDSLTVLDSWCSIGEKTVFVLDRSRYFTHVSSGHSIDGDFFKDPKKTQYGHEPSIQPFDRSLWTCAVEAVVGYSRLIWDLFTPDQKCIEIIAVSPNDDTDSPGGTPEPFILEKICTWQDSDQNLDHLLKSLAKRSHLHQIPALSKLTRTEDISKYPNCDSESAPILKSLEQALTDLGHLTQSQIDKRSARRTSTTLSGHNNGRIILISSFQNEKSLNEIIIKFEDILKRKNDSLKSAAKQENSSSGVKLSPINYCDLVIVNTFPITDIGPCSAIKEQSAFKPYLHVKTYTVRSGRTIGGLLNNLCLQHHNLKSTTITGIPMKEEQNASSSSQYDVEIVHCSSIHEETLNLGSSFLNGVTADIDRNGFPCKTFKLNWCTPRTSGAELHHCVATSRITAVDVNSRPSACLTNFLLNGKQVMLEIYKSKSNRMTTHVLASHNGELFIHSLATSKHRLNIGDPPSMSESLGGKVGDYRVNDFVTLMKQHTLVDCQSKEDSLSRTCNLIKRQTLYWPVALGHTILLNVPNLLGELLVRIPKESMSQADVDECKRMIDNLIKYEKDGQGLPSITMADVLKTSNSKSSNSKLDQLYKLLWNELEYFLRVHSTTAEHEAVLDYLLERHGDKNPNRGTKRTISKTPIDINPAKKQRLTSKLIPEISESTSAEVLQQSAIFYKTGMSLFQTWTHLYHMYHRSKSKLPFVGRTQPLAPQPAPIDQQQVPRDS